MITAIFMGWIELFEEKTPPIAMFIVESPSKKYPHGSVVNYETLVDWGIRIPPFPSFERWEIDRRSKL